MLEIIVIVLIVISGSALCALSETALLSVPRIKVRQLAQSKKPTALALLGILQKINRPIATIVILNNIFNIVGSIVIGSLAARAQGSFSTIFTETFTSKFSTSPLKKSWHFSANFPSHKKSVRSVQRVGSSLTHHDHFVMEN